MIKVKNGELQNIHAGLSEIADKELPVKTSYWVSKIIIKIETELRILEKQRIAILKKHSEKDDSGNPIIVNDNYKIADITNFYKDINDLMSIEIDIGYDQLMLSAFEGINIKPVTLMQLNKIIVDDLEE